VIEFVGKPGRIIIQEYPEGIRAKFDNGNMDLMSEEDGKK
jgi:hypothetical protein